MKQSPFVSLRAERGNLIPKCHPGPFASCHSERVSRSPERSEGEESYTTQGKLREGLHPRRDCFGILCLAMTGKEVACH